MCLRNSRYTANKPLAKSHRGHRLQLSIALLGSAVDDNFISAYLLPPRPPSRGMLAANFSDAVGGKHAYQKNATGFCGTAPVSDRTRVCTHATSASVESRLSWWQPATRHVVIARHKSGSGCGKEMEIMFLGGCWKDGRTRRGRLRFGGRVWLARKCNYYAYHWVFE